MGEWRRRRTVPIEDQIAARLARLAFLYGLHPWHIGRLTGWQWEQYRDSADEWQREQQRRDRG